MNKIMIIDDYNIIEMTKLNKRAIVEIKKPNTTDELMQEKPLL